MPVKRTLASGSRVNVRYKKSSESTWRSAHPLLRIHPEWNDPSAPVTPVDSFAGVVFDLSPGTVYDVELTLVEPGKANQTLVSSSTTRALPPAAPAVTVRATTADNLQAKFNALAPGAVLELDNGTYNVSDLFLDVSGTASQRIYIRGKTRSGVVLRNASRVLQLRDASHVVIENLTLEGSGVDSGTNASSSGLVFWNGALQEDVTLRDLDIRGVDTGIVASGTTRSVLVYNNSLRGNNTWDANSLHTNATWNDDGIRIPGEGHAVFENTLHGFGDTFAVDDGTFSAAVFFYRNRITMTGDDAFEGDYATRNIGFYDNHITNSATLLSLDPLWGGPLYCFRNISINTFRGPFKFNNTNSGFLIYNNTIVRTEGRTGWGWNQSNNGDLRNWSYRNNILLYRGSSGSLIAVESTGNNPMDMTYNAWFPDGPVWWTNSGGTFGSLAAARSGLPAVTPVFDTATKRHQNDVISPSDPFASAITLGADHLTEFTSSTLPTLRAGVAPKNAGTPIPNINDGYTGSAPDMGAIIEGRPSVRYGAVR